MKIPKNLGMLLLAIWLIATGANVFLTINFAHLAELLAVLAIAAGVCILLGK